MSSESCRVLSLTGEVKEIEVQKPAVSLGQHASTPKVFTARKEASELVVERLLDRCDYVLFTKKDCPKCKTAKAHLTVLPLDVLEFDAESDDGMFMSVKHCMMNVPWILCKDGSKGSFDDIMKIKVTKESIQEVIESFDEK